MNPAIVVDGANQDQDQTPRRKTPTDQGKAVADREYSSDSNSDLVPHFLVKNDSGG